MLFCNADLKGYKGSRKLIGHLHDRSYRMAKQIASSREGITNLPVDVYCQTLLEALAYSDEEL